MFGKLDDLGLVGFILFLVMLLGTYMMIAWVACGVAAGFGYTIPFWPVCGTVFLISVLAGWFKK